MKYVYVINYEDCLDGDSGAYHSKYAYETREEAVEEARTWWEKLREEIDENWVVEVDDNIGSYEAYDDGWYEINHVSIYVDSIKLKGNGDASEEH